MCALWPLVATLAHADVVTDWNLTAIRAAGTIGISTGVQSRLMAMTHAAIFDAVNSIERRYTPYAVEVSPPAGASAEAAAITAAHGVLTQLVPDERKMLDTALTTTLAKVADGPAKDAGAPTAWTPPSHIRRAPPPAPGSRRRQPSRWRPSHTLAP
jgi:hypothetical protein